MKLYFVGKTADVAICSIPFVSKTYASEMATSYNESSDGNNFDPLRVFEVVVYVAAEPDRRMKLFRIRPINIIKGVIGAITVGYSAFRKDIIVSEENPDGGMIYYRYSKKK